MTRKRRVTVVVPVYNEGDNIPHFTRAVEEALGALPYDYEILFVDDGSREESRRVLRETEKHVDHFLRRAGLILLPTAFLLWCAAHVNTALHPAMAGEETVLSALGRLLLPLLRPLGLNDWRAGVILLSGAAAKETMASTAALFMSDGLTLTWQQALILGVVALLLPPCLGTLMTVRGELGGRETGKLILRQVLIAWAAGAVLHGLLHLVTMFLR